MTDDWHTVLAYALTGEWLALPEPSGSRGSPESPDVDRLLADLAGLGWSGQRLVEAAGVRRAVPVERVRPLGAARFTAVVEELRTRVLAGATDVRTLSARALTPDEQRLATDRPPHWG